MTKPVLLVAEDNDLDAVLLARLIERCGEPFQMMRVEHGEAAIDYLRGHGVYADRGQFPTADLLLLDLKMPRKDGFAVLRWRQETPAFAQVPVIVFSSSALREDIERAYSLGANSYIVKPSDPLLFERMVKGLHEWWGTLNMTASRS